MRGRAERQVRYQRAAQGRTPSPSPARGGHDEAASPGQGAVLAELTGLVGGDQAWLSVPEVADALGVDLPRVRRLLDDRALVGVRRGSPRVLCVPRALVEPEPLVSLPGTVTVLADAGYTDAEALRWLFTPEPALGAAPVAALRARRIAPVRRQAQALLF